MEREVSKSLTITFVLPVYWPAIGGCELHTHELVGRLSEVHNVNVITLIDNQEDKLSHELWMACILRAPSNPLRYEDNHAEVIRLPLTFAEKAMTAPLARMQSPRLPGWVGNVAMTGLSDVYMRKLVPLLKRSDLVHCVHGGVSYLGCATLKAARFLRIPFIYTPLLHLSHKDWIEEMKKPSFVYSPQLNLMPRCWTDAYWYKLCFGADVLITMTDYERRFFIGQGIPEERIFQVGVGPVISDDGDAEQFRAKHNVDRRSKIVLFLGRNHECKGIASLLGAAQRVWEKHEDTYFFFVGPQEGKSKELFEEYEDARIVKTGEVSLSDKTAALRACTVFCMPSLEESLGGTVLEAWMFEKPIVGTRIPALMELMRNDEGGFLVNPTPEEIADKIVTLLENPAICQRMGQWGKKRVAENYTWEIITEKMNSIYTTRVNTAGTSHAN